MRLGGAVRLHDSRFWIDIYVDITSKRVAKWHTSARLCRTRLQNDRNFRVRKSRWLHSVDGKRMQVAQIRTWIDRQAWILATSDTLDDSSFSCVPNTEALGPSVERHSLQTFATFSIASSFSISTTFSSIVDYANTTRDDTTIRTPSPTPTPRTRLSKIPRLGTRCVCGVCRMR